MTAGAQAVSLRLLEGTPGDRAAVRSILDDVPRYAHAVHGGPFPPEETDAVFDQLPPGVDPDIKSVYGVFAGDVMVGVAELGRDYPAPGTTIIGLLAVGERFQGRGIGRAAVQSIEALAQGWCCGTVRIGVVATNLPGFGFWRAVGYEANGETKPWQEGSVTSQVIVMQKGL